MLKFSRHRHSAFGSQSVVPRPALYSNSASMVEQVCPTAVFQLSHPRSLDVNHAQRFFKNSRVFAQVDVFAEHVLEGNMLAIFTDARGLTTEQMQSLLRARQTSPKPPSSCPPTTRPDDRA